MFVIRTLTITFDNQLSAKLIFTVQTFKKQNSVNMEKYNGLSMDILYISSSSTQINNGIVIFNFAVNNAFE